MTQALLSTAYFAPVQWYQKLLRYDRVLIDVHEHFQKQTYRNRCLIATTQGVQALTVPVVHGERPEVGALRLSDHGQWRRQHWQALQSAYGETPFFEYYEDDLRPFFTDHRWTLLADYNDAICRTIVGLLDIQPRVAFTTHYLERCADGPSAVPQTADGIADFRDVIRPKNPLPDPDFQPRPYYQVFALKHAFLPNLSILDLLMNMGPESIFYL